MFYEFPKDLTVEEVREVIARANERLGGNIFIEIDRGDHLIFNYAVSVREAWAFPTTGDARMDRDLAILKECRGLTFLKDGTLIARKFHKFHNVNEREETLAGNIDWSVGHVILDKLDGSMITPFPAGDEVKWCTKQGMTEVADKVYPFISRNPRYNDFARHCLDNGLTPMFEFCSLSQRIVLLYPEDRLVLLAVRNNASGEYLPYGQLAAWGEEFDMEVVACTPGPITNVEEFLTKVRGLKDVEGFIVRFDNGHMVKMKADEYCLIHGTISDITSEKFVLRSIVANTIDDALPLLPEDDRSMVEDYVTKWNAGIDATVAKAHLLAETGLSVAPLGKEFAAWVKANVDPIFAQFVFGAARGQDVRPSILMTIERYLGTGARIDVVRPLWGGHRWDWGSMMSERIDEG